ncbi:unnamed protein product, partial [Ectocarpus sp. 12 AP-2014]
ARIEDEEYDRGFYLRDDGGGAVEDSETANPFLGDEKKFAAKEAENAKLRARGEGKIANRTAKASQMSADQDAWENNRLLTSGAMFAGEVSLTFDDGEDQRVQLIVHSLKPPFLDGRVSFSMQQREKREKGKMRQRFWELGGSRMGKAIGVEDKAGDEKKEAEAKEEEEDTDYKKAAGFQQHMKKTEANSHFSKSKTMAEQREFLPIFQVKEDLLRVIRDNQVVIIVGETGSGKTTQMTQYLHEGGFTQFGKVGCTQPRRVAAMSVAKRVSEEMGVELGDEKRRDLKLVVTSATLDAERFSDFFGGVPVYNIPGRTFHVEKYFSKTPQEDYVDAAVKQALQIHLSHPPGDILIFMTGQEDIETTCEVIAERLGTLDNSKIPPLLLLPMYSQLPADLQAKIFESAEEGVRK